MRLKYQLDGSASMWARTAPGEGYQIEQYFAELLGDEYDEQQDEILSFYLDYQPHGMPLYKALKRRGWTEWTSRDLHDWVPGLDMKQIVYEVAILRYRTPIEPFEVPEGLVYLGVSRER